MTALLLTYEEGAVPVVIAAGKHIHDNDMGHGGDMFAWSLAHGNFEKEKKEEEFLALKSEEEFIVF